MRTIKSVKASLFTLIFAFLAIGLIANTSVMNKEKAVKETAKTVVLETWYFTGGESDDPTDPSNYTDDPNQAPLCNEDVEVICQISAPRNGTLPDMTHPISGKPGETVATQILEAQDELNDPNAIPQTNDTVKEFRSK
ncbi:hypothetical protein ORI89_08275 [Sphingobacterium sp. UT-1RO-CII-1]|uniref:hypothetical protein n=1 Tax=Sphingobacterium sp. UT-1RO-CII-1 TaxID=2995225 RepID=UPI00227A11F8|nr:hypothetical protein [Sphingobacterium sp. UT-1RO-CII-1]MCY4779645.1 hypothetical protein [Sphingobacterium sp. UT-1RO-CII-1]